MKTLTFIKSLMLAVIILTAGVLAKSGGLRIIVTDAVTGDPVKNAVVSIVNSSGSGISDSAGIVNLTSIPSGDYTVKVTHRQYEDYVFSDVKVAQGLTSIEVRLTPREGKEAPNYRDKKDEAAAGGSTTSSPELQGSRQYKSVLLPTLQKNETKEQSSADMQSDSYFDAVPKIAQSPLYERRDRLNTEPELPPFDMFFRDYGTNGFVDARRDNKSTFGLDVDDASYTLVRRYLTEGNIPPAEALRVEEFVNHFDYGYNTPTDGTFRIFSELSPSPFRNDTWMLKLGIKAREISDWTRKPIRLVIVIDESGSMGYDTRLQLVKRSVEVLARQLDRSDRIAIVAYRDNARIVMNWTGGNRFNDVVRAMGRIFPSGSTNVASGLEIAYRMASEHYSPDLINRIILFSDGVANVGPTSADAIIRQVTDQSRRGIVLSTFGVGMGNYNDVLLEQLATKGNGRYAYLNDLNEADKQLADQFTSAMQVVARDAKIQVTFDPRQVSEYRLIGYENRDIADRKFRDNRQDGGEIGAGHEVTALYEIVVNKRRNAGSLAQVALRWNDVERRGVVEINRDINWTDGSRNYERSRPELKLAIVAAEFALALKGSEYSTVDFDDISRHAEAIARELPNDQTRELADLVVRANQMMSYHTDYRDDDNRYDRNYKR